MNSIARRGEQGGGYHPFGNVDMVALENEMEMLKTQARVDGEEIADIFAPAVQPFVEAAKDLSIYAVGFTGMVGEFGARLLSTARGRLTLTVLTFSTLLAACGAKMPTEVSPTFDPVLPSVGTGDGKGGFEGIPTPEKLLGDTVPSEAYINKDFGVCIIHQFEGGVALAPTLETNCGVNFDLDNNKVVVTGDSFINPNESNGFVPYTEPTGEGYRAIRPKTVAEMDEWMKGMNLGEEDKQNMLTIVDDARVRGVDVNISMKTILNKEVVEGKERLTNIVLGIAMGTEGGEVKRFNATLEPLTEDSLLKDMQVASVDFTPQFDGTDSLVMEVYPSGWKDNGVEWVSPQWLTLQEQIAASGERFNLNGNGTVQDGATTIPGFQVSKEGKITITVDGEQVSVDSSIVNFDDKAGLSIKGYSNEDLDGNWKSVQENIVIGGGLSVVLGEKVDGGTVIDKFVLDPSMTTEQQDFLNEQLNGNAEKLGLDGTWIKTDDNRILFVSSDDPTNILAERKMVEKVNRVEVVWDWAVVEQRLSEVGVKWGTDDSGVPTDLEGLKEFRKMLREIDRMKLLNYFKGSAMSQSGDIIGSDGASLVVYEYVEYGTRESLGENWPDSSSEGYVVTRDNSENTLIISVDNMTH